MRLKTELNIEHIIQRGTSRWRLCGYEINVSFVLRINKIYERGRGVEREYYGGPSYDGHMASVG